MEKVRKLEEQLGTCPCQDEKKKKELEEMDKRFGYGEACDELGNPI